MFATRLPASGWRPLAAVLGGAGALHLSRPQVFVPLVPARLGSARAWVYGSGLLELACAAGLTSRTTRRASATATALLFVGVFPGNLTMAAHVLRSPRTGAPAKLLVVLRLPLQVPLVAWALAVRRSADRRGRVDGW